MKQQTTKKLLSYWNSLRAERLAPERDDIDPAAIAGILLDTFILEVDPPRAIPIRVAGARMTSLFARELKGSSFVGLFEQKSRECLKTLLKSVLGETAPAVAGITAAPLGRPKLTLELLLLPLRHHGKTHARILGSMTPTSSPAWLGLIETLPLDIRSMRIIRPDSNLSESPIIDPDPHNREPLSAANGNRVNEVALRLLNGGRAT